MSDGIVFSEGEDVAYLPKVNAIVQTDVYPKRKQAGSSNPGVTLLESNRKYTNWGAQNDFPQEIIRLAEQSTELPSLLDWKARAAHGKEVLPFTRVWNAETKMLEDEFVNDPEILQFLTSITFRRYMREAYTDFFWFWNVFPELITNPEKTKIAYLGTQDASWCRWGVMNKKGLIDKRYVKSDWNTTFETDLITLDVIDPYAWDAVQQTREKKLEKFVYPISYPSPGKAFYQLATWDGVRTSGWLEIAGKIPGFKKAIMHNQMHIKYLIRIPNNYWPSAYEGWDNKTIEEKAAAKKAKLKEINERLTKPENAGKSILNEVGFDHNGEKLPGWDIEVIDDKIKDGAYLEDSQEASAHLMRALGLDPTLVGHGPGRKMGAGSGSDKRVAFNLYCALQQPYRDVVLEPLYFIAKYNGWTEKYPLLTFKTVEIELQTLDKAHQTSQEVTE